MDSLHLDDLRDLVNADDSPCISIYLPTFRAGREVRQNAIRWKNLVDEVRQCLSDYRQHDQSMSERLKELDALTENDDFWQHQSDGLAAFASANACKRFRLPLEFDEFASVGNRYHVSPLLPLFEADGQFYILAVSQNSVRLLSGTKYQVGELSPEILPTDLQSALNIDEYMSTLQHHSGSGVSADQNSIFHGHGGSDPDVKKQDEILQFFHRIDDALQKFFDDKQKPLVFAGVDYLFPIFQKACSHAGLVDQSVTGSPDDLSPEELHEQAWSVVEPVFSADRQAALERYSQSAHTDRATEDVDTIVSAAQQGQVETLLVAAEAEPVWGVVSESGEIRRVQREDNAAEDLLNYAVIQTLLNSGAIYTVERDQLNGHAPAVATLRYPQTASLENAR